MVGKKNQKIKLKWLAKSVAWAFKGIINLQLLTKSPSANRMSVRRIILAKIVMDLIWRRLIDWNEITMETPIIHINLQRRKKREKSVKCPYQKFTFAEFSTSLTLLETSIQDNFLHRPLSQHNSPFFFYL